jgi:hypothetical protein
VEILNTTSYQTVPLSNSKIFLWAMFKAWSRACHLSIRSMGYK